MKNNLILRDNLALDRTKLANQRTILAFSRTGLYLIITALAIFQFDKTNKLNWISWCLIVLGSSVMIIGIINYIHVKRKLKKVYT